MNIFFNRLRVTWLVDACVCRASLELEDQRARPSRPTAADRRSNPAAGRLVPVRSHSFRPYSAANRQGRRSCACSLMTAVSRWASVKFGWPPEHDAAEPDRDIARHFLQEQIRPDKENTSPQPLRREHRDRSRWPCGGKSRSGTARRRDPYHRDAYPAQASVSRYRRTYQTKRR